MALIGTISGSVGAGGSLVSATAISGTLIIADASPSSFPAIQSGVKLFVSGNKTALGADTPNAIFGGDTFVSGAFGTDSYIQMKPVNTLRIPTNTTASYIYTSGSTNDLYFTQYFDPYTNTTRLRWLESQLQTGVLHGGLISSTSGSTTYNISSGSGIIVSPNASLSDDPYPTIRLVDWGDLTGLTLPSISTTQITYIAMDSTGTPYLKSVPFINGDYAQYIVLGRVLHTDKAGTNGAVNQPAVSYGTNQFRGDFVRAFGPIKLSGHTLYVSGTTGLKKDAGDSYAEGRNYTVDPDSPNYISSTTDTAQNTSKIFYEYVNASGDDVILNNGNLGYAAVDFAQYNNAGTLATVGTGNKFTIQRVFWFPNAVNRAFYVYYGNTIYSTIADAQAGISTEVFTEGKNTRDAAIFLGYVIVKGTLVDFTDPTTYKVIQAGPFRAVASAGGGASGTPGGADTQVQFNDAGVFNGTSDFKFVKSTGTVSMANLVVSGTTSGALVSSGTLQVKSGAGAVVGSISTGGVISGSSDLQIGGNITGSNAVLSGDLAVNGGDITTTAATFNLIDSTATTVNFAGAATALTIGANGTGATTIRNVITSSAGKIALTNAAGSLISFPVGAGALGPPTFTNSSVGSRLLLYPSVGASSADWAIGMESQAMWFGVNVATATPRFKWYAGTTEIASLRGDGLFTVTGSLATSTGNIIGAPGTGTNVMTLISSGNIIARLDTDGSADGHKFAVQDWRNIDQFSVDENGNAELSGSLTVTGSIAVNGGNITSTAATVNIANTTPTTVNIANNASNLYLGKTGTNRVVIQGNLLLNNNEIQASGGATALTFPSGNPSGQFAANLTVVGDVAVNGGDLTTTATTFNLLNGTVTTLNVGGAATSILVGGTTTTSSFSGATQIDGRSTLSSITEKMVPSVGGTGAVPYDLSLANIFYANGPTGDITANFTNVPTTNNRIITPTVILSQSATPRIVNAVQIDTVAQIINWANGVPPTGTANKQDVFGFSLIRSGSTWKVLGQMSTYG